MAVPDTTTFNLQTVVNVVNPTSDDLPGCFSNAVSNKFNATYKAQYYAAAGNKNNLLMFRDYEAAIEFTGSSGQNDFAFICSQTTVTSYWHNGTGTYPSIGDVVYTNSSATTGFTSYTYMLTNESNGLWLEFDGTGSAGEVTNTGTCSTP
jgi:hypothetical protein